MINGPSSAFGTFSPMGEGLSIENDPRFTF